MKRNFFFCISIIGFCLFNSCQNKQHKAISVSKKEAFVPPNIPSTLNDNQQKIDYVATHYWDHYDFADTALVCSSQITEQAFVNFIDLLSQTANGSSTIAINNMLHKAIMADSSSFSHFVELSEHYLYDPNSPLRSEIQYMSVLEYIQKTPKVSSTNKIKYQYQLKMVRKNQLGTRATDFVYTDQNGTKSRMSKIKAEYTILFFNNPECEDCKRVKSYLEQSAYINKLLTNKRLQILSIYPDEDLKVWREASYSNRWINGYDASRVIQHSQLYDLRAITTLYLLNRQKQVLLKDAPVENIEVYLSHIVMLANTSSAKK